MNGDYSDHGEPDVSYVASTHPGQPTPSGLAETGADLAGLASWALVVVAVGLALFAAAQLAASKRGRV